MILAAVLLLGMGFATATSLSLFRTLDSSDAARALVTQRQDLLRQINANLGYGGMIHSFKNAVLRGDAKFITRATEVAETLESLLDLYRGIPGLAGTEAQALDVLGRTIARYAAATRQVASMREQGVEIIAEIDRSVKIDDTPALAAFATLNDEYASLERRTREETNDAISSRASLIPAALAATMLVIVCMLILSFRALMRQLGGEPVSVVAAVQAIARCGCGLRARGAARDGAAHRT